MSESGMARPEPWVSPVDTTSLDPDYTDSLQPWARSVSRPGNAEDKAGPDQVEELRLAEWERELLDKQAAVNATADKDRLRLIAEVETTELTWLQGKSMRVTVRTADDQPVLLRWLLDEVRKLRAQGVSG